MKKLTRDDARAEAARLQANPILSPQSEQGKREIIDCLVRNCQSPDHCAAVMTAVLDGSMEFPRDLETTTARLAYAARRLQQPEHAPAGCERCYLGPDVTTGEIRWYEHVAGERNGYTCASRCNCERGRWLTHKDRERESSTPSAAPKSQMTPAGEWARRSAGEK